MDFDHQHVPVADGVGLHTAIAGQGPPIVLLHGFPQTHLMWRNVAADLAADHTVICPDLRGYGASDKPAGGYDKRTMAADVVALAEALGHDRFALGRPRSRRARRLPRGPRPPGEGQPPRVSRRWTCGTSCAAGPPPSASTCT